MFFHEIIVLWNLVLFQFNLIFLYWMAGILIGSIFSVFAAEKINYAAIKMSNGSYRFIILFLAALLGAASPVCMYGAIPLIASLGRKGMPQNLLAAFMVSSILINPNLFVFSFALGAPLALIRLLLSITAGIIAGLLVKLFFKETELFNFKDFAASEKCDRGPATFEIFLKDLNRGIIKTAPYFFTGILLTALFDRYIPKSAVMAVFGNNKGLGVLFATLLGIPVYVCGGGAIPLIKAWMNAGMSYGSAIAFMMIGPATKLTNLSAVKIILGIRNFALYIAFNIIFAVATGLIIDYIVH